MNERAEETSTLFVNRHNQMKVLKFGGTSVGMIESLLNVKKIVEGLEEPSVIVVSALGGLTDGLIATARQAASGDSGYADNVASFRKRHHDIIDGVVLQGKREETHHAIDNFIDELSRLYDGVNLIKDLPEKTLDEIVSFGERMSSVIVASMIEGATHKNSPDIIKTEKWFGKNIADSTLTDTLIKDNLHPEEEAPIVMGGFISTDRDTGEITNLGRGGSDFTAALVAASLGARELQIWTDVDGFMTSDPRIIPEARIIDAMSFVESMELCSFGAKVIYPPTIYPVFHKNIPIKILNTFNPAAPGTLITDSGERKKKHQERVRGISALKNTSLITICGPVARNIASISSRTFNALARKGIGVFLVSPTDDDERFSFALKNEDKDEALLLLNEEFKPESTSGELVRIETVEDLAIVAMVGDNILSGGSITPRVYNTFMRNDIESFASSEGASRTTVTFVVREKDVNKALSLVHSLFF